MKKLNTKLSMLVLVAFFVAGAFTNVSAQPVAAADRANADTWVGTGYETNAFGNAGAFLPWENGAWMVNFMYETLAGWNTKTQQYDYCIAEKIEWLNDGTLVNITINPAANWSGPGVAAPAADRLVEPDTPITAADVKFSYEYLNNSRWGNIGTRIESITTNGDKEVHFNLHANSTYSLTVKDWITTFWPILNEVVWKNISQTVYEEVGNFSIPTATTYQNRWYSDNVNTTVPLEWQVSSGPYIVTDCIDAQEWGEYNEDWWGEGILYPDVLGPSSPKLTGSTDKGWTDFPKKLHHIIYPSNEAALTAMQDDLVDQAGKGIPEIRDYMALNDNMHVFWDDQDVRSYVGLAPNIEIAFNTYMYPLSEPWFRKACAWAVDYAPISTVAAANNWVRGSPQYLNKANPGHAAVWDQDVEDDNTYTTNATIAQKYLTDNNCYKDGKTWYATVPAQADTTADLSDVVDADPDTEGTQVKIGPYTIITPVGWTDVGLATEYWASGMTENLGIDVTEEYVDFNSVWQPEMTDTTFDMAMQCCGKATDASVYDVFNSVAQNAGPWAGNASAWRGTDAAYFKANVSALEVANATESVKIAKTLQKLYAENLPSIPTHINCFWYQYNTRYWKGFLSSGYFYQQITSDFTVNTNTLHTKLVLAVVPSDSTWNPPVEDNSTIWHTWPPGMEPWEETGGIPWEGLPVAMALGALGAALLVLKKRRN